MVFIPFIEKFQNTSTKFKINPNFKISMIETKGSEWHISV